MAIIRTTVNVFLRGISHHFPLSSSSPRFSALPGVAGTLSYTRRGISFGGIRCAASGSGDGRKVSARLSQVQQLLQEAEERALSADDQPTPKITLDHVTVSFARSGGPGGQNVNKVNTKVDMRFNVKNAYWLSDRIRERIIQMDLLFFHAAWVKAEIGPKELWDIWRWWVPGGRETQLIINNDRHLLQMTIKGSDFNDSKIIVSMDAEAGERELWLRLVSQEMKRNAVEEKNRINKDGELVISSTKTRTQKGNIEDALAKLQAIIDAASYVPPPPSEEQKKKIAKMAAIGEQKRLKSKKVLSDKKAFRRSRDSWD